MGDDDIGRGTHRSLALSVHTVAPTRCMDTLAQRHPWISRNTSFDVQIRLNTDGLHPTVRLGWKLTRSNSVGDRNGVRTASWGGGATSLGDDIRR